MVIVKVIRRRCGSNPSWYDADIFVIQNDELATSEGGNRLLRDPVIQDKCERDWRLKTRSWPSERLLENNIKAIIKDAREYAEYKRWKLNKTQEDYSL